MCSTQVEAAAKTADDERIVLVEKKVALRGNGTPHSGKVRRSGLWEGLWGLDRSQSGSNSP